LNLSRASSFQCTRSHFVYVKSILILFSRIPLVSPPKWPLPLRPPPRSPQFEMSRGRLESKDLAVQGWKLMIPRVRGCIQKFPTGRLERELQMVQLSATRCSCIAILWVSLVSFTAITLCVASQRVFMVVYFVIESVRKLLDTLCVCVYIETIVCHLKERLIK
jgi:hypothetical protein